LVPQSFLNVSGAADILSTFWYRRLPLDLPGDADLLSTFLLPQTSSQSFWYRGPPPPQLYGITFQNSLIQN
jgi:hypothetical protein